MSVTQPTITRRVIADGAFDHLRLTCSVCGDWKYASNDRRGRSALDAWEAEHERAHMDETPLWQQFEAIRFTHPVAVVDERVIHGNDRPETICLQLLPEGRSVWETVYGFAFNEDGTYWARTYNHLYNRVTLGRLRVTPVED